jgi:hypothetical protein
MTPKEKAEELVDKYYDSLPQWVNNNDAKLCALIAVQQILCANPHSNPLTTEVYSTMLFWNKVKREIEELY